LFTGKEHRRLWETVRKNDSKTPITCAEDHGGGFEAEDFVLGGNLIFVKMQYLVRSFVYIYGGV
jgi:hypothetical protein